MSEYRKTYEGGLFFITLTVVGWIDVFTRKEYADILVESLEFCKKEKQLAIFAYVIMPSHIHLIVRRNEGLLSDWLRDFKSHTAEKNGYCTCSNITQNFKLKIASICFGKNQIIQPIYLQKK